MGEAAGHSGQEAGGRLVVAVTSRALFALDESHAVYEQEGVEAYRAWQIAREDEPLAPGDAFPLVRKLLALAQRPETAGLVEVILVSRNSADTGLRVMNSLEHHGLGVTRAVFSGGREPWRYVQPLGAHLFLSTHDDDVRHALAAGCAAALIMPSRSRPDGDDELRIAFDGDAVLFSDEAEQVYQAQGLPAFVAHERERAHQPLPVGPFQPFLSALHRLQARFAADACPIRTALVTARGVPAHERVVRTLREWGVRIDESLFLGGMPKGEFLAAFGADIFFDDHAVHVESARGHVATGHVPSGVRNPRNK
jgi:5'-nucleotidase